MRRLSAFVVGAFVTFLVALGVPARAAVTVLAPGSTVAGKTIAQWTEDWWNWANASGPGPISDTTGARATQNQSGPVFFVAGDAGGPAVNRTFNIPSDKFILLPLANWLVANGPDPGFSTTLSEATQLTTKTLNPANLFATLDGVNVPGIATHREAPGVNFTVTMVNNNDEGFPPGTYTDAGSDGYWLMLGPLGSGTHTLHFGGVSTAFDFGKDSIAVPSFSVDVTAAVTAIPLPASVWGALPLIAGLLLVAARYRVA